MLAGGVPIILSPIVFDSPVWPLIGGILGFIALLPMFFDDEISSWWCIGGDTWRCTPAEALGLWLVIVFFTVVTLVSIVHVVLQHRNGTAVAGTTA